MSCNACKKASRNIPGQPEKEGAHGITKNPYHYNTELEDKDSHDVAENPYLFAQDPEHRNLYGVLNKSPHHIPKQSQNAGLYGMTNKNFHHNWKEQETESLNSISEDRSRNFREQRENEEPFVVSDLNRKRHALSPSLEDHGLALNTDRHNDGTEKSHWHTNSTVPTAPMQLEPPPHVGLPAPIAPYPTDPGRFTCGEEHDCNRYATKKTIAQGLIDLSLLAANVAQFKHLLTTDDAKWKSPRLFLVTTVLALQMIQTCVLVVLGAVFNMNKQLDQKKAEHLNNVSLCLMFAIVVLSGISTGLDSRF